MHIHDTKTMQDVEGRMRYGQEGVRNQDDVCVSEFAPLMLISHKVQAALPSSYLYLFSIHILLFYIYFGLEYPNFNSGYCAGTWSSSGVS